MFLEILLTLVFLFRGYFRYSLVRSAAGTIQSLYYLMDSFSIDMNGQDSCQNRSRSINLPPSPTSQFRGLNIINSSNPSRTSPQSSVSHKHSFEPRDEQENPSSSSTFITAPVPQQTTPFPLLSQEDFDWTFSQSKETQGSAPLLRLDPAELNSEGRTDRAPLFNPPANMR